MNAVKNSNRVPATVLSGFLGSGKTTLLNVLLRGDHGLRVAVVVNEFGQVGIDGSLVAEGEQFVELDNGCLCCVLNAELEVLLVQLLDRGSFDCLLLETTGMADPLPVGWVFSKPTLSKHYRLDAIVTVVDALNVDRALADTYEARLQIERGDIVVLNKLDLVDDDGAHAEDVVRGLNDAAVILRTSHGKVPWDLLLGHERAHDLEGQGGHQDHQASFQAVSFQTQGVVSDERLEAFLSALPMEVYRTKGIVCTDAEWGWSVVNAVAGRFDIEPYTGTVPSSSALVFIGVDLDEDALMRCCDDLVV